MTTFDARTGSWIGAPGEPAALREWQLSRAWKLVTDVVRENPYYRRTLRVPKSRDAAAFASLPTTSKDDVVADCEALPPYGSRTTCPPAEVASVVETSGTSGKGRETYALDARDEAAIHRTEAVGFAWAGVRPGSRVLLTFPVGTAAAGQWFHGGLRLLGANVFAVSAYPTERRVEILMRYGADLVIGTPSYVQRLAHAVREAGPEPRDLRIGALLIGGEAYSVGWARRLAEIWKAPLYEQYGCTERAIAWSCPGGALDRDGDGLNVLHFPADNAYVEVVDPETGSQVGDGELGELIVTPLQASASPLVRFRTRDRVQWREPGACRCGRPLPGITAGGVQRYDDMIKIRGQNIWPRAIDAAVLEVPGVEEYRAEVVRLAKGQEVVTLTVEPSCEPPANLAEHVQAVAARTCGLRVDVKLADPGAITTTVAEGFAKINRWKDLRARD